MANVFKVIHNAAGQRDRLVRAANKPQAIRYVASLILSAEVATADDVYQLALAGVKIEEAETVRDLAGDASEAALRG